jgi:NAD-dependent dihydropyrimidine dehydrogenase PreA subunit
MTEKMVRIDQEKCNACGLCVSACHEGAISIQDGKVVLRETYCDGLGNCLPVCPTGALSIEERTVREPDMAQGKGSEPPAYLNQWPIQLKLVPLKAPYFNHAALLISADCAAYTYRNFHTEFMRHRITLIGCPKLDNVDYSEKLTNLISENHISSLRVVRMEVPCCGGIEWAALKALKSSGKEIPLQVVTLSTDGRVIEDR